VRECPDPLHYLDTPGYELDLEPTLRRLADSESVASGLARDIEGLIRELAPYVLDANAPRCFVHNDLHEMNIMCTSNGGLLSVLDWGDAGWGDPTTDFASVPLEMLASALEGYNDAGMSDLGQHPEARFVWARLSQALDDAIDNPGTPIPLKAYRALLDGGAKAVSGLPSD
jgi:aminoglycoside phosphotransferase (APT) family kinase protein